MFKILVNKFIKNNENYNDPVVQKHYGILCSILSIICNTLMVIFKLGFGYTIHSSAIVADGFNNLSDMGSNIATYFGFKLASLHPDRNHPYGHGRMEYVSGMMIAFFIFVVGFGSLKDAIIKCFKPVPVQFNYAVVVVLIVAIITKFWMSRFNIQTGEKINSISLKAAGQDNFNDVLVTSATLVSLCFSLVSDYPIDGIVGSIVSLLVIKSGYEIFKQTTDLLLGQAPDEDLVQEITELVEGHDVVLGLHDLLIHDYGTSRRYMTIDVEVDCRGNIMDIHNKIDMIEREILAKYNIMTTIHIDPVDVNDEKTKDLKVKVVDKIHEIDPNYNIHDFRVIQGIKYTQLLFDVVLPYTDHHDKEDVIKIIENKVKEIDSNFECVMEIDYA